MRSGISVFGDRFTRLGHYALRIRRAGPQRRGSGYSSDHHGQKTPWLNTSSAKTMGKNARHRVRSVGGGIAPAVLPHHRAYGFRTAAVHVALPEASVLIKQRDESKCTVEGFLEGFVQM